MNEYLNKFEEMLKYVKEMSEGDFDCGHSVENFDEFIRVIKDDDINANELLYDYYLKCFEECKKDY